MAITLAQLSMGTACITSRYIHIEATQATQATLVIRAIQATLDLQVTHHCLLVHRISRLNEEGKMPQRLKKHLPNRPKTPLLQNAHIIISNANKASSAFLKQFEEIRKYRKAKGTATDAEQDILRAMLTFAWAGLDSMVKQLVRDALPAVVKKDQGAEAMFVQRTKKKIYSDNVLNTDLLLQAILTESPKDILIENLIFELTSGSLQSVDELFRIASFFNIPSKELIGDPQDLRSIFGIRNQISHEMDIDFSQRNRHRRPRSRDDMIQYTNTIFMVAKVFLEEVDKRLA
jgi:hypothetical protein